LFGSTFLSDVQKHFREVLLTVPDEKGERNSVRTAKLIYPLPELQLDFAGIKLGLLWFTRNFVTLKTRGWILVSTTLTMEVLTTKIISTPQKTHMAIEQF